MRTTLILDDALLREARLRAAARDLTVSQVVNEALREAFRRQSPGAAPFTMITFGPAGQRVAHEPADLVEDIEREDRETFAR